MFNRRKLKELREANECLRTKNADLADDIVRRDSEILKHKSSAEIEHESYLEQKHSAEILDRELRKAVDFIEDEGYKVAMAAGSEINYSFYGASTEAKDLEDKVCELEKQIENYHDERSVLRAETEELLEENADLKAENKDLLERLRHVKTNKRK